MSMPDINPDLENSLVKLQNDYELARVGLQGTLWGAWAALTAIVAIAVVQIVIDRYVVRGWEFVAMVAVIVIPVTFYGAFIFKRAIGISVKIEKQGGWFSASSPGKTDSTRPPTKAP
jgi:hypothetical protein